MNVQIVSIQPNKHGPSAFFEHIKVALVAALTEIGLHARPAVNQISADVPSIILGAHQLDDDSLSKIPDNCIIYNLEQLEADEPRFSPNYAGILANKTVWDYSRKNLGVLSGLHGAGAAEYVPIGYSGSLAKLQDREPTIDVLFYGAINERRRVILDALRASGINVHATSNSFGADLDALIERSRIILNIHYHPSKILEAVRLSYPLANRKVVVSEYSEQTEASPELLQAIVASRYEDLVETCRTLLARPEALADIASRGFRIFSGLPYARLLQQTALASRLLAQGRGPAAASATVPVAAPAPVVTLSSPGPTRSGDRCPQVSVIVRTQDRPLLLRRALASICAQRFRDLEVVVVNDGGPPVEHVCAEVVSPQLPLSYVRHASSLGISEALNAGLRAARGSIIAYLDDDDVFLPTHVETLVECLRDPVVSFCYTESAYVVERLVDNRYEEVSRQKQIADCRYSSERLHVANYLPINTWGHRRSVIDRIGMFDTRLDNFEDWDFLLRYATVGNLRHIPQLTAEVHHRTLADSVLGRHQRKFLKSYQTIYDRHPVAQDSGVAAERARLLAELQVREQAAPTPTGVPATAPTPTSAPAPVTLTPWLPAVRLLPGERAWAAELAAQWRAQGHLPHIVIAVFPSSASRPGTLAAGGIGPQWLPADTLKLPATEQAEELLQQANTLLLRSEHAWVGFMEDGDRLTEDAVFRVAQHIVAHPDARVIYTDEDVLGQDGSHLNPHCKPDFNLDYLRSLPYIGGLLLMRRDLFEALGGFDPQREGAEDYDLLLRAWEHLQRSGEGEAAIGHVAEVLYHRLTGSGHSRKSVPELLAAGQQALQAHFDRLGIPAEVQGGPFPPSYRVHWPLPQQRPLVSILIPTRDQLPLLQRCIESVIEKTRYPAFEILIIDNDSRADDAVRYLHAIEAKREELGERLRVIRVPGACHRPLLYNHAVGSARGEYLLLLDSCTAALHDDWLDEMMGHAVRADVGAVGAKLLFPDGKIQHAGVILGIRGPAEHPFIGRPPEDRGYFGRAQLVQDLSAVTGACLLVRKSVYEDLGGLDEQAFKVSYNDIDLCLKIRAAGLRVVFTPFALLMHEGSASQKGQVETKPDEAKHKRFAGERLAMYDKWLPLIARDPAYNRHLSLASTEFLLDDQVCVAWDPEWRPRPRLLAHAADREGCGEYRIIAPMRSLVRAGHVQGWETMRLFDPAEMERISPDSLVVQRQMEWPQIESLERHVRYSKAFRVFEIDDLITNLPLKSVHRPHIHKDIIKRFRKAAGLCNRLVVATEPLARAYAGFSDEVVVCPNYLERARWGDLRPARAERTRPRVGWAGGVGHAGDLDLIVDVVRETASEVDWVFFGMCPQELQGVVREFHTGIPLDQYAPKLASLDLDLAVAPLESNAFNEAKSHLRLLEYGVLGYPVICSDLTPYQGDFPVTRVANRFRDWVRAIRDAVADPQALRAQGDALRDKVLAQWMLEDHLEDWLRAWTR